MSDVEGTFERKETGFRGVIRDEPSARFQPESERYHLYVSYACPWAHGTLLVRSLRGLKDAITVDIVDPYREENGWQFSPDRPDCTADTVNERDYLQEVYKLADPTTTEKPSVPVLWDRKEETIVNNESIEIMQMLNNAFEGNGVDLYPDYLADEIDAVVDDLYNRVNNGVYRAGFATTQAAYTSAVEPLFAALDEYEKRLADQRYLIKNQLTLADLRLFVTLVRFDEVYHTHFMCNHRSIREYEHLWPYLRDIYTTPGVAKMVHMDHIKEHYYRTHPGINPNRIIPIGPGLDFSQSHNRDKLPGSPPTTRDS